MPRANDLIQKLSQPVDEHAFFTKDVYGLIENDPREALTVLEHAEAKKLSTPHILTARIHAHIALRDAQGAWNAFHGYLNACRAAGGFEAEPPFESLRLFFEEVNERQWAIEVREIAAMECGQLLGRVLGEPDPTELMDVNAQLDAAMVGPVTDQAEVARTCALKACVLQKLGQKAEALKFWKKAKDAEPEVAEFWRTNSLLA
jgi:hypothetical protein